MIKNEFDSSLFSVEPYADRIEKPWGYEIHWAQTPNYTAKILHIIKGKRLSLQYHDMKMETLCTLKGKTLLWIDNEKGDFVGIDMEVGKGYTMMPFQRHRIEAIEDTDIVEVSTPETGTTFRLEDDFKRPDETEELRMHPGRGWEDQ